MCCYWVILIHSCCKDLIYIFQNNTYVSILRTSIAASGGQSLLQLPSESLIGPDGLLKTLPQTPHFPQVLLYQAHTWKQATPFELIIKHLHSFTYLLLFCLMLAKVKKENGHGLALECLRIGMGHT